MNNNLKGFSALFLASALYGTFGIWIRLLHREVTPYQQIAFRNTTGFLITICAILLFRKKLFLTNIGKKYVIFYCISSSLSSIFFTFSILTIKITVAVFALYIGLLLASLLISSIFFKEKITIFKIVCLLLVLTGLIFFALPFSLSNLNGGLFLGVLAGVMDAVTYAFNKYLSGKIHGLLLLATSTLIGIIIASILLSFTQQELFFFPHVTLLGWMVGIVFGLFYVGLAFLTIYGFQHFDLNLGAIVLSSELFFTILFALFIFGELSAAFEVIGGIFIVAAIALLHIHNWSISRARW